MPELPQTEKLAILFADICGSTAMYDEFGDTAARYMILKCIDLMIAEIAPCQGTLVKTLGDGIMCTFPDATLAMRAACRMQSAVERGEPGGSHPMYIHIGFHYGEVLREGADVYGNTVNIAARVADRTRAREILTTREAVDMLPSELRARVCEIYRAEIKGKQREFDIFRVIWEAEETEEVGEIEVVRVGSAENRRDGDE
ncbi:MAG: adenylate/guanylate cyclase domain-containing protein [Pseudomonadota bacterium]